jgi:2-polyprenyl-3-methyl-5-hydroxy-6-metoxy-1,4-benzoquinol methylase
VTTGCKACHYGQTDDASNTVCTLQTHPIKRCRQCGLVYIYPPPKPEEIRNLYSTYHEDTKQLHLCSSGEQQLFSEILDMVQSRVPAGALLDVGASYGYFLHAARQRGFAVKGVELADEPAAYARTTLNLDVANGQLEDLRIPNAEFDVVTLLNVLEHLTDPYRTLCESIRIMKPGGVIAIVVPNLNFGYALLSVPAVLNKLISMGITVSVFDVPAHLFLFTPQTLSCMLRDAGFTDISITNAPVIYSSSRVRTAAKVATHMAADVVFYLSLKRWVMGYSMLAIARKGL